MPVSDTPLAPVGCFVYCTGWIVYYSMVFAAYNARKHT
jgi:hypothetical protein